MLRLMVVLCTLCLASGASADLYLSEYMGGASGSAVTESFAPYMTVVTRAEYGGFGVDTAGAFTAPEPIEFVDVGPFGRGIGAHPMSQIDFHLNAFRAIEDFDTIFAIAGIDVTGTFGARFTVLLDGDPAGTFDVTSVTAPSVPLAIPVGAAETLSLITEYSAGVFGNHAAWADARLAVVPEPHTGCLLLLLGAAGMLKRRA